MLRSARIPFRIEHAESGLFGPAFAGATHFGVGIAVPGQVEAQAICIIANAGSASDA